LNLIRVRFSKCIQLILGEALQSHLQLALGVDASQQVLPHRGLGVKRLVALLAIENGSGCGIWRPETGAFGLF